MIVWALQRNFIDHPKIANFRSSNDIPNNFFLRCFFFSILFAGYACSIAASHILHGVFFSLIFIYLEHLQTQNYSAEK